MICGAGDVRFTQLPEARFVHDCIVKPAFAGGHASVRFVPISARFIAGLFVLNNWPDPSAAVAAISAEDNPTL